MIVRIFHHAQIEEYFLLLVVAFDQEAVARQPDIFVSYNVGLLKEHLGWQVAL